MLRSAIVEGFERWAARRIRNLELPAVRPGVAREDERRLEALESIRIDRAVEAATCGLIEAARGLTALLEKTGEYYYDDVEVKRWILGDGGRAGNCEECEEAADLDWVDMDYTYDMFYADVDEPPGHPHCSCEIENATKRKRVYV